MKNYQREDESKFNSRNVMYNKHTSGSGQGPV
jgi:hypothetical protein